MSRYAAAVAGVALVGVLFLLIGILGVPDSAHAAVIRRAPNNLDLIGYWPMNEGRGTTVGDESANANSGSFNGAPQWTSGKRGEALKFDGSDDGVKLGDVDALKPAQKLTIVAWVYRDGNDSNNYPRIVASDDGGSSYNGYYIRKNNGAANDKFQIQLNTASGRIDSTTEGFGNKIPKETWTMVAMTYDGSQAVGFQNGEKVVTETGVGGDITYSANEDVFIGKRTSAPSSNHWHGKIDGVRIYNRTLSESEIMDLYQSGGFARRNTTNTDRFTDNLVSHWTFDGPHTTDTTVEDVESSNDATRNGSPITNAGHTAQGMAFDGSSDYLSVSSFPALGDAYTFQAWVYPHATNCGANTDCEIIFVDQGILDFNDDNDVRFCSRYSDCVTAPISNVDLNEWQLLTGVMTGSQCELYKNKTLLNSSACTSTTSSATLNIARHAAQNDRHYDGLLDDVRIYDDALSQGQIEDMYNATKPDTYNAEQSHKLTDGLVGMWDFDGPNVSGSTVTDASSNTNDGTMNGDPVTAIGKVGQAMTFDGDDDYVDVSSSVANSANMTISVWVKVDTFDTSWQPIVVKGESSNWRLQRDSSSDSLEFNPNGSTDAAISQTGINDGEWHHVVAVQGDASSKIYLDSEDDTSSSGASGSASDIGPFEIGRNPDNTARVWEGKIDQLRIYNRALSENEIERLYHIGR